MSEYENYYNEHFQHDLENFLNKIPEESKFHTGHTGITIQYFTLTPNYNYLDVIPTKYQGFFIVSLFWTVLIDQVFYTHFDKYYNYFQNLTHYPKFIGNCTAPSSMASRCGNNQHPRCILRAANDYEDTGNILAHRKPFDRDKASNVRNVIRYKDILKNSRTIMKTELDYFISNNLLNLSIEKLWNKCINELPNNIY